MKSTHLFVTSLFASLATAWPPSNHPWVFFAKFNETFEPLFGIYLGERYDDVHIFAYGDTVGVPAEFNLQTNYALNMDNADWKYVGFYLNELVYGSKVELSSLNLDHTWMVGKEPFYSCALPGGPARGIFHSKPTKEDGNCFEVDIYILPYDRINKSPVFPTASSPAGAGDDPGDVLKIPCDYYYYGNPHRGELAEFVQTYRGKCDIFINKNRVYGKSRHSH